MKRVPAVCIVGAHNSGKTTFIEKVIKILTEKGYKITAVKHDPKGKAKTDTEGKDSWKMFNAGARQVILASPKKLTTYTRIEENYTPEDILKHITVETDLVIFEGFKWFKGFDKFEVIRKEENRELLTEKNELKGVITDFLDFSLKFDINKPEEFVEYLEKEYLKKE